MKSRIHPIAFIVCLIFTGICFASCKKSDDDGGKITIDGFYITDASGNHVGHHGPFDDDWIFGNSLGADEMALFNFPATVTLDNTTEATVNGQLVAYPNPMGNVQAYYGNVSDSVVFRMVVVNDKLQVLYKTAVKVKGSFNLQVSYADRTTFPNKSSLRVYYSVSALNKPNYKAGYGDIKVCDNTDGDCF